MGGTRASMGFEIEEDQCQAENNECNGGGKSETARRLDAGSLRVRPEKEIFSNLKIDADSEFGKGRYADKDNEQRQNLSEAGSGDCD